MAALHSDERKRQEKSSIDICVNHQHEIKQRITPILFAYERCCHRNNPRTQVLAVITSGTNILQGLAKPTIYLDQCSSYSTALMDNASGSLCSCKCPVRHNFLTVQTGERACSNRNSESQTQRTSQIWKKACVICSCFCWQAENIETKKDTKTLSISIHLNNPFPKTQ